MNFNFYIFKYLRYRIFARHKRGHGIHSPFLFKYINEVFLFLPERGILNNLKKIQNKLECSEGLKLIELWNIDAIFNPKQKEKQAERKSALIPGLKYSRLLHNICTSLNPDSIVEIGNSEAISAFHLFLPAGKANFTVIEQNSNPDDRRLDRLLEMEPANVQINRLNHPDILNKLFDESTGTALCIIHLEKGQDNLSDYFDSLINKCRSGSVIVLTGIHKSDTSESAWQYVKQFERVRVTLDLFFLGILFTREELMKENYIIKY
jgi:hypothetical protein